MNSVATKDNSVAIENNRTMRQGMTKLSQQRISKLRQTFQRMSRPWQILCHDRRKLCHDATFKAKNGRQEDFVKHRSFMSRQTQHEAEMNFVATKTNNVVTKVGKITKKNL